MKNNELLKTLGNNLRAERNRKNLSQMKLAELAHISHMNHIGRIERGEVEPKLTTIVAILNALDIKFEDLYKQK